MWSQASNRVQIWWFCVATEEYAVRRARERVGFDEPNVSIRFAALESELGVQLFERISGGVRLTEVGRTFLVDARRIISDLERAQSSIKAVAFGTDGRLRLGICEDAATRSEEHTSELQSLMRIS